MGALEIIFFFKNILLGTVRTVSQCYLGFIVPLWSISAYSLIVISHVSFFSTIISVLACLVLILSTAIGQVLSIYIAKEGFERGFLPTTLHQESQTPSEYYSNDIYFYLGRILETVVLQSIILAIGYKFAKNVEKQYNKSVTFQIEARNERILNESKTRFISNLSHEMRYVKRVSNLLNVYRNPLHGMIGISEIMKLELKKTICSLTQADFTKPEKAEEKIAEAINLSEANIEMIKDISSNAQMLLQIFSTSLQISNMELGKISLNYSPFNIVEMVDSIVSVFSTIAKEKGICLQSFFDFDNVPIIVKADQIRLSQVLVNFVSNSVKYTKKGNIYLDVSLVKPTDEEFPFKDSDIQIDIGKEIISGDQLEYIKIICQDTGMGIPKEELGKLYQPFNIVKSTLDKVEYEKFYSHSMGGQNSFNERHGIGLNLSLNFIHVMKGKLDIKSEIDRGTTLTLYIPVIKCSKEECSKIHNTIFSKISFLKQLGSSTISRVAILEDDTESLSILTKLCNQILKPPIISHIEKAKIPDFLTEATTDTLILYNHKENKDLIEKYSGKHGSNKFIPIFKRGEKIPTKAKPIVLPSRVESIIKSIYHTISNNPTKLPSPSSAKILNVQNIFPQHGNRILIVDDNAINRKILKKALSMIGYSADMASDGSEALDIIKKQPDGYEYIFMDLLMPNMGGKDSCKFMRQVGCNARIIAVTANIWESSQSLIQNGFSGVLRKPFTIDDIKQIL